MHKKNYLITTLKPLLVPPENTLNIQCSKSELILKITDKFANKTMLSHKTKWNKEIP